MSQDRERKPVFNRLVGAGTDLGQSVSGRSETGEGASAIIAIAGLSRKFGVIQALHNIDLEIMQGELFGLLGPNGAGKTTLISILSTIIPAGNGSASVCGYHVGRDQDEVRRCIGIVFQDPSLDEELTGRENLDFHGRLYGMNAALRKERIDEVLQLVDLADRCNDSVKTYSGGMRRRLEIARGLMHTPRVLFLDEPTLGLDPQTRRKIWNYIRELKYSFGITVILTTHYMDEAEQLCTRVAIIDRGKIVALDRPDALKNRLGGDVMDIVLQTVPDALVREVESLPGVNRCVLQDGRLLLSAENAQTLLPQVFKAAQGVAEITSVAVRQPNLEDVFIDLTGRDIRDEPPPNPKDRMRLFVRSRRK